MVGIVTVTPLQLVDPMPVLELPGLVRGTVAFAIVFLLGAVILWRFDGIVDRAISASVDRPLSSLGYGVATHLTIVFFGAYTASQFAQLTLWGRSLVGVGIWSGLAVLAVVAALGFTVVGVAIIEIRGGSGRLHGLLLGSVLAGLAALPDPLLGGMIWLIVVSTGIGGPVRVWFHAADDMEAAT